MKKDYVPIKTEPQTELPEKNSKYVLIRDDLYKDHHGNLYFKSIINEDFDEHGNLPSKDIW